MPSTLNNDQQYSLSDVVALLRAHGMEMPGPITLLIYLLLDDSDGASSVSSLSIDSLPSVALPDTPVSRHPKAYEAADLIAYAASKNIQVLATDSKNDGPTALVCANCAEAIVGPGHSLPVSFFVGDTAAFEAASEDSAPVFLPVSQKSVSEAPVSDASVSDAPVSQAASIPSLRRPLSPSLRRPLSQSLRRPPQSACLRTFLARSLSKSRDLQCRLLPSVPQDLCQPLTAAMDADTNNALNAVNWDTPPPNANNGNWYTVSKGKCVGLSNNWGLVSPQVTSVKHAIYAKKPNWYEARNVLLELRDAGQCEMF
ncbi:hypothetical protein CPB85DRAFT_1436004 [Mucidula mucida]|nr:hypothetical protein CPB85DRAFT_1436004 [Mucidula mucida]